MKIRVCVVGSGYVGLVTGTCLAELGHSVVCVDSDKRKLAKIHEAQPPERIEPGGEKHCAEHKCRSTCIFEQRIAEWVE